MRLSDPKSAEFETSEEYEVQLSYARELGLEYPLGTVDTIIDSGTDDAERANRGMRGNHVFDSGSLNVSNPDEEQRQASLFSKRQNNIGRVGNAAHSINPIHDIFTKCAHGHDLLTDAQITKLEEAITRREELAAQLEADTAAQEVLEAAARAGTMALNENGDIAATAEEAVTDGDTLEDVVEDSNAVEKRATAVMNKTGGEGISERSMEVDATQIAASVRAEADNMQTVTESGVSHAGHGHGPTGP